MLKDVILIIWINIIIISGVADPLRFLRRRAKGALLSQMGTPNLPTNIVPSYIAWLKLSWWKSPMGLGIPPLEIKIMLESSPLKRTMLVVGLGVFGKGGFSRRGVQWMGVVLYDKTACTITWTTTPCFRCTPPLMNLEQTWVALLVWRYLSNKDSFVFLPHHLSGTTTWVCYMIRQCWRKHALDK